MKYYIIAGEASGDLHGSNLMKALIKEDLNAEIRFWGGDLMQSVGGTLVSHYKNRVFMGFVEVILNLCKILNFIKFCKNDITQFNPDVIIFIDNSGFNLRIAKWAKQEKYKTNYYISPQVWASRARRVKAIKRDIDQMFTILPFEKDFYKKYNYNVQFVGHPLIDGIINRKQADEKKIKEEYQLGDKKIIALLPGSRKQEIAKMLSTMLLMINEFPEYQFVVAGSPGQTKSFYTQFLDGKNIKLVSGKTYDLLSISYAAVVTSGTATLETALFKVPQVVCYKGNWLSYQIAKRIITLKYISLVNLIMDKEVVTELIQNDFSEKKLKQELQLLLQDRKRKELFLEYFYLEQKLGGKGASEKTAKMIVSSFMKRK